MNSKIEELIEELQDYINSCKYDFFSNTIIKVDIEVIDEKIAALRAYIPEEVKRSQSIISNKNEILNAANKEAENIVIKAQQHSDNMINDSELVQQAYVQANAIIEQAKQQAQDLLDQAQMQANSITYSAMQYTDDSLAGLQNVLTGAIEAQQQRSDELINSLNQYLQKVNADRSELYASTDNATEQADNEYGSYIPEDISMTEAE